jgi:DNA-binding response OmpR family regulator
MKNPNNILTRFQLSEYLNKDNYTIKHSNIIDVHIKNIRKKIGSKDFIKNIRSVGYKIEKSS